MRYIMIGIMIALMMVASCSKPSAEVPVGEVQDRTSQVQTSPSEDAVTQGPAPQTGGKKSPGARELKGLFERKNGQSYQVTYDYESKDSKKVTMTHFHKGDKFRMDTTADGKNMRTYMTDKFYMCAQDGEWTCLSVENKRDEFQEKEDDAKENLDKYLVDYLGKREIAGVSAECYDITGMPDGSVEYCFSDEAVPLFIRSVSVEDGKPVTSVMTATSYRPESSESDFVLPAQPQDLNRLMEGFQIPEGITGELQ